MTRNSKISLFCFAMLMFTLQSFAIVKPTKLYVFGFAASFNDSTVYLTDIMELDSAWTDVRTKFLYSRENYSYQFKHYLKEQGLQTPTCIILFAEKRKDVETKYAKLRKRYTKKDSEYNVRLLNEQEFKFNAISAIGDPNVNTNYTKEAMKAEEEAMKKARAEAKLKSQEMQRQKKESKKAAKRKHKR